MKRRSLVFGASGLVVATAAGSLAEVKPAVKVPGLPKKVTEVEPQAMMAGKMVALGKDLMGYLSLPVGKTTAPAVVVCMEAFGLNANIKGVCDRLAKAGYAALAPDFYHGETFAYSDAPKAIEKLKTIKDEQVVKELELGLKFLAGQKDVDQGKKVGGTGFCMGGRLVFLAAAAFPKQVGAGVAFYGGGIAADPDPFGRRNLLDRTAEIAAPLMFMYGSEDSYTLAEEHGRVGVAMSKAKKAYSLNVFAGAGHGFMSDRRDSYNQAAADEAWGMTMAFFDRHLRG
jgi:carboxymethylenebutenolidase